jgi:HD-GYP domain-containing protein (c-di-GMP phosphodiesterase class II)
MQVANVDNTKKEIIGRMKTFLAIINSRNSRAFGHSEQVHIFAIITGLLLGLRSQGKKLMQCDASLHDIGKIKIGRTAARTPRLM